MTPYLVEFILILRLLAAFPLKTTSIRQSIVIFTFPVLVKIARTINFTLYMLEYIQLARTPHSSQIIIGFLVLQFNGMKIKLEWMLQIFDTA